MEMLDLAPKPQIEFPVVGIGASAGGLEAVTAMFQKIEPGMGLAYVLVMHLDPNHESLMAELLSRKTHVEVRQIKNGDRIEPDCLHVIPPGYRLTMENQRLRLERFEEPRGLRRPIDSFFESLAKTQGEKCACVVLSGTGADGTAGLRIAKDLGGVVAVQTPDEARYDGMPFSAISTNLIDFTLPADEIIGRLQAYFDGHETVDWPPSTDADGLDEATSKIFDLVKETSGNDFSGYKPSMLLRRLKRRMQVGSFTDIDAYLLALRDDPQEQSALAQDFLINVTSFFRDWDKFETLRRSIIVPLIKKSGFSDELRIWVAGCSSGQEAYTMAMLIDKTCEELKIRPLIQIFATDIDEEMLIRARRGEYLFTEFSDLPKTYQESYTIALDGKFEMTPKIREMVRFSYHNLIQDPPFTKIDLISCRNLLIYLGDELQSDLFPTLHFSLKPDGHLFLGTSESISRQNDLFTPVDQDARIFKRLNTSKRTHLVWPRGRGTTYRSGRSTQQKMSQERDFPEHASLGATNDEIFQEYAPPFVRLTKDGRIIGSSGDLSLFLMARPGEERGLYGLLREGVRDIGMALLADVAKKGKRQAIEDVEVQTSFGSVKADIVGHPMRDETVALIFIVQELLKPTISKYAVPPISADKRVADLQDKLSQTQLQLKSKVEEIETANEELKSSNEEMMSMNEELQSANEELTTANEELKNKIDELTLANADLDNFLGSADLAMIVLDRSLRIRHVTAAAKDILPIQHSDRGRYLTEFNVAPLNDDLGQKIRDVMDKRQAFSETTEPNAEGKSFFLRVTPYFFKDGTIEGATITMTDITGEVSLRHELAYESERRGLAMRAGRMGLAELDVESGQVTVDAALVSHLNLKKAGHVDLEELTASIEPEDVRLVHESLTKAVESDTEHEIDFRVREANGGVKWVRTRSTPYTTLDGRRKVIGPTLDITDIVTQERRELVISEMSHRIKNLFAVIGALVQFAPKQADNTQQMSRDLVDRISALGRVYDLARKKAKFDTVPLEPLIETVLAPHVSSQSITLDGPEIEVDGDKLNTFTLVIHELTTNAHKYGALSDPDGTLRLTWKSDAAGATHFIWSETQPDFAAPEGEPGFGHELLDRAIGQLGGEFSRAFTENGVELSFSANFASVK